MHISDLHLGGAWGSRYLKKIITQINSIDAEMILITGDIFDGAAGNFSKYIELLKSLTARKGVYFTSGNHEVYAGSKKITAALEKAGIVVLDNDIRNIDGLQLIGIRYPDFYNAKDTKFKITEHASYRKAPSILMFHTPTDITDIINNPVTTHSKTYFSADTDFRKAKQTGVSLQLSGHTHKGQFFPFNIITKRIFNGYDYGLHKSDDFHIYTTSGAGTWGPPLRIGSKSEIAVITLNKD
ncbi:MAG: metallophosphoesterase [bacterium]|nr:metallophosphoesterase [bacterium]